MDQLTAMRVFTMIAKNRSFKAAAAEIGVAPSVVSKHLLYLEKHLGTQLVRRTTRSVDLTELGDLYLEKCRSILKDVDDIEAVIRSETGQLKGVLQVNAPPGFAHRHIAPHLPLFADRYPDIHLDLMTAENDSENTLSKVDVQIRVAETSHQENVMMQILAPNRRKLVASPAYLKYRGTPEQVSDLNKHSLITLESGNQYNDWHFRLNETTTETFRAHGNLCLDSGDAILRTVLNGGGLSMMSTYIVGRHITSGALVPVLDAMVDERTPIHALWRKQNHRIPKIEVFIEFLTEIFGAVPYWDKQTDENRAAALRASL